MHSVPPPPKTGASLDNSEEGRELLQTRLIFLARTIFQLFGIVFLASIVAGAVLPELIPKRGPIALSLAATGLLGLVCTWWLLRWRPHTPRWLRAIDAALVIDAGMLLGAGAYIAAVAPSHVFLPFILAVLLVFARVFVVPSSAMRTALLSTACIAPVLAADVAVANAYRAWLGMPFGLYAIGAIAVTALTVTLATIGSRVLYGLRREIREAMRFGQYTLERKLGEGGMGVVFKARHALLRRPTAIKLLPPEKAGADDVARFEREVQLTSELTHPNTIAIYDYGRSVDGVFYYVMEYIDGVDLDSLVERTGSMPAARAVPILAQICDALDEAHEHGVVHRDIKPANVILSQRGRSQDFVKVVDFGLVKELARSGAAVTEAGTVTGTPAYLAPEALRDPDAVGPASDLYAVGAVGYFLLTGQHVFDGKTVVEICSHHLHTEPVPPSKRTDAEVPPQLEALILACLAKSPSGRPASARALADALAEIRLDGWTDAQAKAWWTEVGHHASQRGVAVADTIAIGPRDVSRVRAHAETEPVVAAG